MLTSFLFAHHGDAHGCSLARTSAAPRNLRDSNMVATTLGSIYGSYPYVSSSPLLMQDAFAGDWRQLPMFKRDVPEDETGVANPVALWKRNFDRYPTMPYIEYPHASFNKTHGCAPSSSCYNNPGHAVTARRMKKNTNKKTPNKNPFVKCTKKTKNHSVDKSRGSSSTRFLKKRRFSSRKTFVPKHSVQSKTLFGSQPIELMDLDDFESLLKAELRTNVLPSLCIEPPHDKAKVNRAVIAAYCNKVATRTATAVKELVRRLDPAHVLNMAVENVKGRDSAAKTYRKYTAVSAKELAQDLFEQAHNVKSLYEPTAPDPNDTKKALLNENMKKTRLTADQRNKALEAFFDDFLDNYDDRSKQEPMQPLHPDMYCKPCSPKQSKPHQAHCFVATTTKTTTRTSTRPQVETIHEEDAEEGFETLSQHSGHSSVNLISFSDQDDVSTAAHSFARRPEDKRGLHATPTKSTNESSYETPGSSVRRLEPMVSQGLKALDDAFGKVQDMGLDPMVLLSGGYDHLRQEPTQDQQSAGVPSSITFRASLS